MDRLAVAMLVACCFVGFGCKGKDKGSVQAKGGPIAVDVGRDGFTPSSIQLPRGAPASLVFTRTTDETCATEVVFPQLNVKKALPKGQPVTVDVPTDKDQTLTFQCGMGMYQSSVVVSAH